jgi:SAM-dependent methyltransferase
MRDLFESFESRLKFAHFPYIREFIASEFSTSTKPPNILDVGCGPGNLSIFCGTSGDYRWFGLDLWEHQLRQAAEKGTYEALFQVNLVNGIPFRAASFDMIVCNEVLMYLPNDGEMLEQFHRALRPGGKLLVYNPISWLPGTIASLRKKFRKIHQANDSISLDAQDDWKNAQRASRITYYSVGSLVDRIETAGFQVTDLTGFRIFRNRLRLMRSLEDSPSYRKWTKRIAARFPQVASDLLVIGTK